MWAVGVLAYELMMQGETPFYHDEPAETEKLILQVRPRGGQGARPVDKAKGHSQRQGRAGQKHLVLLPSEAGRTSICY